MKSEEKKITNEQKKKQVLPKYLNHLENLKKKFDVKKNPEYSELVNFSKNEEIPIHRWIKFKEGYSAPLVRKLVDEERLGENEYVFDPFVGSGTTCLVAQEKGYPSIGIDILPVASFASKVKTTIYSKQDRKEIKENIKNLRENLVMTNKVPKFRVLERMFFTESQKNQMLKIKGLWENIQNEKVRDFFRLAYISIIEDVSNRKKDGNGIKYDKNKEIIDDPISYYEDKLFSMYSDLMGLERSNEKGLIFNGSILDEEITKKIKDKKISSVIFSPPYANCFDYAEVYKMELWLGGFVEDYSDFDNFRNPAIRSHVNTKFDKNIINKNKIVNDIAELISAYNIWNKDIPDMVKGYFDDMTEALKNIFRIMDSDSHCKIIVANSGYKGVLVPTDLILADISQNIGFRVEKIIHARDIRASSQQMKELHGKYDNLMRESIIFLKKEGENYELSRFT